MPQNKEYIEKAPIIKFIAERLSSRDESKQFGHDAVEIMTEIEYTPPVDVVEVVRCKDCRHMTLEMGYVRFCNVWERPNGMGDDGFCNYGELRADA